MRHKRNNQIIREWRILLALDHREWFNLAELRDSLPRPRPHMRTIRRDMEALALVFPIERRSSKGDFGIWQYEFRLRRPLERIIRQGPKTK
jgi:hypothetical protein